MQAGHAAAAAAANSRSSVSRETVTPVRSHRYKRRLAGTRLLSIDILTLQRF